MAKDIEPRKKSGKGPITRAGINAAAGLVPFVGGFLSAAAGYWGEKEQAQVNKMMQQWLQMLQDELREKGQTISEIMARLDMANEDTVNRVESSEYQSLLKKGFRNWSSIDSEDKRQKIRNILANAAATTLASDDVVSLFLEWLQRYSDFHFQVIGEIYKQRSIGRGSIWRNLGRPRVREDSPEADLYKLLIHDLSVGHIVRQHRETNYAGEFIRKPTGHKSSSGTAKSAFDDVDHYELTELGKQFVHYAMNELAPRLEFSQEEEDG
jgi:hypothetical protein